LDLTLAEIVPEPAVQDCQFLLFCRTAHGGRGCVRL
jgi:hypothetical protein